MLKFPAYNIQNNSSAFYRAAFFSVVCGILAALLNLFPIYLFSELTLIFGPALSLLVALSIGPWWGALTAAIASITLVSSWGHYYGFLVFIPEALVVGTLYRKGWNELVAVLVYWLVIAIPFVIQLALIETRSELALDLSVKYLLNSFLYTLIASALLWFFSVPSRLKLQPVRSFSLRNQIFTILMVSMAIPISGFSLFKEQEENQQLAGNIQSRLERSSNRIARGLERFLHENKLVIEARAEVLALSPPETLSSSTKLNAFHNKHPEFISMLIASREGLLTAFSGYNFTGDDASRNKSVNQSIFDRDYFQAAIKGKGYISQAFKGRAKGDPIVSISSPVLAPDSNEVIAVVAGSLNLYQLEGMMSGSRRMRAQNRHQMFLVLDSENKVIYSSPQIKLDLLQKVNWELTQSKEHPGFFEVSFFDGDILSGGASSRNGWQVYALYPEAQFNQISRNNYHRFALMLTIIIILVSLLAVFLSYQINRPLQWLFKRIVNFNVTSSEYQTLPMIPLVPKEMVTLIKAHESAEKRLRHAFQTERLHQKKRISAEKASEAKSNFLSAMSHELRTPLNAISGFSQLLVLEESLNKESQEFVNEINIATQHLMLLINDVLDMSKIESEQLQLNIEAVNIEEVLVQTLPMLQNQAKARNVSIELKPCKEKILVLADKLRLKQVLINLLTNAIKYNKQGGQVIITLHNDTADTCAIRVTDTGVGIAAEQLSELFKVFNRLDKENSEIEGYGIGLVISKKLLELMKGEMKVESELEKGSCFCVCLPVKSESKLITAAPKKEVTDSEKSVIAQMRILYVEDNDVNALVMNKAMKRYSQIECVREANGKLGLERLRNEFFDLVLLDISLPDMNGFDILKIMQVDLTEQYGHVFAVSANAMSEDIDKGLAAGFDEYVTKPVKFDLLFNLIKKYQNQQ